MTFTSLWFRVAAVALAAGLPLTVARADGPAISHFTLANGLELVVIPDRRAPVVTHMIWYKVGAADETPGKSGLAHFLEHLMFKGTAKNPAGRFSQVVATIGGQENAFTSSDYTGYYQRVPTEQLKTDDGIRGRPHDRSASSPIKWCCRSATSFSKSKTSASPIIPARG